MHRTLSAVICIVAIVFAVIVISGCPPRNPKQVVVEPTPAVSPDAGRMVPDGGIVPDGGGSPTPDRAARAKELLGNKVVGQPGGSGGNEYTQTCYDEFLKEMNKISDGKDGVPDEDFQWYWGEGGKHDVMVLKLHEIPISSTQMTEMGDVISDIYHLKLPDNKSLKIIIRNVDKVKPLFEQTYSW